MQVYLHYIILQSYSVKTTSVITPVSWFTELVHEYYEENSQTYHHPSSPSQFHPASFSYHRHLSMVAVCFVIKPDGIVKVDGETGKGQQRNHKKQYACELASRYIALCFLIKVDEVVRGMMDGDHSKFLDTIYSPIQ